MADFAQRITHGNRATEVPAEVAVIPRDAVFDFEFRAIDDRIFPEVDGALPIILIDRGWRQTQLAPQAFSVFPDLSSHDRKCSHPRGGSSAPPSWLLAEPGVEAVPDTGLWYWVHAEKTFATWLMARSSSLAITRISRPNQCTPAKGLPKEFRNIGVRIGDDALVTAKGLRADDAGGAGGCG